MDYFNVGFVASEEHENVRENQKPTNLMHACTIHLPAVSYQMRLVGLILTPHIRARLEFLCSLAQFLERMDVLFLWLCSWSIH